MLKDYRTAMHACLRSGAWDEALSVWSELRAKPDGPAPCTATYAAALRACGGLGDWTTASNLLAEMRTAGGDLKPEARHYALAACAAAVADDRSLDAGINFSGEWWGAEVDEEEEDEGGRRGGGGGRGGESSAALRALLSEMENAGFELGWEAYAAVSWARTRQRQWHRASVGVLELMDEFGVRDSGPPVGGVLRDVTSPPARVSSYEASAAAAGVTASGGRRTQQQRRRVDGIRGLYVRLLSAAGQLPSRRATGDVEGDAEGARGHDAVRQVLADAEGRLSAAGGVVGPWVLAAAARAYSRAGDWRGARDIALREFIYDNGGGSSLSADGDGGGRDIAAELTAVNAAVVACARAGELDEAEKLAERAERLSAAASADPDVARSGSSSSVGRRLRVGAGLDRAACLALAKMYELAGRQRDAEGLRARLHEGLAVGLGLEAVIKEGMGGGTGRGLPSIGGLGRRRLPTGEGLRQGGEEDEGGGEEEEEVEDDLGWHDGLSVGGADECDLFLEWMSAGEEVEQGWGGDDDPHGVAAMREEELTARELEGW